MKKSLYNVNQMERPYMFLNYRRKTTKVVIFILSMIFILIGTDNSVNGAIDIVIGGRV
jgi:hypothetical protein